MGWTLEDDPEGTTAAGRTVRASRAFEVGEEFITGGEALAGSTRLKAATAQKICLNMISTLVMTRLGRVRDGKMIAMRPSNAKLRERFSRIHGTDA